MNYMKKKFDIGAPNKTYKDNYDSVFGGDPAGFGEGIYEDHEVGDDDILAEDDITNTMDVFPETPPMGSMNLYQLRALETASVPTLAHAVYGLVAEAGEVAGIMQKAIYKGREPDFVHMREELGDVLWYCALLAKVLGTDLETIATDNIFKLQKRHGGAG